MRSQIALARGAPGGLVRIRMSSAAKTASKALQNLESRSRSTNVTVETRTDWRLACRVRAGSAGSAAGWPCGRVRTVGVSCASVTGCRLEDLLAQYVRVAAVLGQFPEYV